MAERVAVLNIVGLSEALLRADALNLERLARAGRLQRLVPVLPAVTCAVQSSMLTGLSVRDHGIVGNGWFDRDLQEIHFWKQSNRLMRGRKVWESARERDPSVTCANLFWWFNMHSSADIAVTPRPIYKADGRKVPDIWTSPPGLRDELQARHGRFPLFQFWGPGSSIVSSAWIARAAMDVFARFEPTLTFVYLPHLDYALQRLGPGDPAIPAEVRAIDAVTGELIDFFAARGVRVVVVSEYGIEPVTGPVAINRVLRHAGFLRVRDEDGGEILDVGASEAFAIADHQVAHVCVRRAERIGEVAALLRKTAGIEKVLDRGAQREAAIDHARSGDLVTVAEAGRWFSYHYWLDDDRAPDFARTVDIHRKPGYDACELFLDPRLRYPRLRIARRLIQKKLGFRTLMDVIPLDASLVRGSHGRVDPSSPHQPILITQDDAGSPASASLPCTAVHDVILAQLFAGQAAPG